MRFKIGFYEIKLQYLATVDEHNELFEKHILSNEKSLKNFNRKIRLICQYKMN